MVQFGIAGDPAVQAKFKASIKDDPVKESNKRGYVTFAQTQRAELALDADLRQLQGQQLPRLAAASRRSARCVSGMDAVDKINADAGEKPNQGSIQSQGNVYLKASFPKLDYVKKATIEK